MLQSDRPDIHKGVGDETIPRTVPAGASRPASFASYRRGLDSLSTSDYPRHVMRFHADRCVVSNPTVGVVIRTGRRLVGLARTTGVPRRRTYRSSYVYVARLEDYPSFRARVRVVGAGEGRASRLGARPHKAVRDWRHEPAAPRGGVASKKL